MDIYDIFLLFSISVLIGAKELPAIKHSVLAGTYNTQELPCGIGVVANPWLVKMSINNTARS